MPGDPHPPRHSIAPPRVPGWVSTADAPLLGWVGRLSHVKGADIAIAALARMRNKSALLVFVGDGPDRPALEAQAAALGVASRVRFRRHGAARRPPSCPHSMRWCSAHAVRGLR